MPAEPPNRPVTVGELFDPESLVAQWVFQTTAVVADLSNADKLLHDGLDAEAPTALIGYHYRQLIARVYEGRRPVHSLNTFPELCAWVEALDGAAEPLGVLRGNYLPDGGSRVDKLYARIRHRSVHHSWVGSSELKDALAAAHDEEAWIVVDHERSTMDYEWPESALLRALLAILRTRDEASRSETRPTWHNVSPGRSWTSHSPR